MRTTAAAVALGLVLLACEAVADSLTFAWVNGAGAQVFQTGVNAKNSLQCRAMAVYVRPCGGASNPCDGGAGCQPDGGMCDPVADFNYSPDSVPIQMSPYDSKLNVANIDGGTTTCGLARESP